MSLQRRCGILKTMTPVHRLLAVAVAVIWGLNFIAIDASLAQFPPFFLVALRFASDAELPDLAERARRDQLTPDAIKRAVVNWVPDYDRT